MIARAVRFFVILLFFIIISGCSAGKNPPQPPRAESSSYPTSPSSSAVPETDPSVAPTAAAAPGGPTSNDRIDAALAGGQIDAVTALKYKVFAQFKDPRLPQDFSGGADLYTDSHIVDELASRFFTLSAEDQTAMLPFLVPPVYKGSWGDPSLSPAAPAAGPTSAPKYKPNDDEFKNALPCDYLDQDNWDSISAMHSPVRFWWLKSRPGDGAVAQRFLTAMDDDIWPKLTGLMGRTPKMDDGYACNGGSGDFDVYITPEVSRSYAASLIPPGCKETPGYIVMNPGVEDDILGHEFMHAIQWSYNTAVDCMYPGNYAWLAEATATWSQDYVYPDANSEQKVLPWFFGPAGPAGRGANLELRNDKHEYAAYLFFFYLTHQLDQPELVSSIWNSTTRMASLEAVDQAIPGGFADVWGDFAVKNLDEPPYDDYQIWDNLNLKPSGASLSKTRAVLGSYAQDPTVDHLSVFYDWFTFTPESRLVTFYNGNTFNLDMQPITETMGLTEIDDGTLGFTFTPREDEAVKDIKVQALYRLEGEVEWILEDWSDQPYVVFCRDAKAERLSDLIIITSNSAMEGSAATAGAYPSQVTTSNIGCWRYAGDASVIMASDDADGELKDQQQVPRAVFERTQTHENYSYPFLHFKLAEGDWQRTYELNAADGTCTGKGEVSAALPPTGGEEYADEFMILYGAASGPSVRRYTGEAYPKQPVLVDFYCPENDFPQPEEAWPWLAVDILGMTLDKIYTVGSDGILAGSDNFLWDVEGASMIYTWNFVPLSEP